MARLVTTAALLLILPCALAGDGGKGESDAPCTGELRGEIRGDVVVSGGTCILRDANVTGSVYMSGNGNLAVRGVTHIRGGSGIFGRHGGWVDLKGQSFMSRIDLLNSSDVVVSGATVSPGEFKVEGVVGDVTLCGVSVADVAEFVHNHGRVRVARDWYAVNGWFGCTVSKFQRDVKVVGGVGNVKLIGASMPNSEVSVKELVGSLTLKDLEVAKMKVEHVRGPVLVQDVSSDEAEIKANQAGVSLWGNVWGKLNCIGNWPGVVGKGNTVEIGEGQCHSGL